MSSLITIHEMDIAHIEGGWIYTKDGNTFAWYEVHIETEDGIPLDVEPTYK